MRIYNVEKLITTIDDLCNTMGKEEEIVVECNENTARELSLDCGFDYEYFDINDELDDYEFEVYVFNFATNSFYDSPMC